MSVINKVAYLSWAARHWWAADRSCPSCGSTDTIRLRRKAFVTALCRCQSCHLMFRVPKDTDAINREFYQQRYTEGFTTDCPSEVELAELIRIGFRATPKDYQPYIRVLQSAGLKPGDVICDFGCSWGYGSWQLRQAGFTVYSYEISEPRARYAAEKLGCSLLHDLEQIPARVDCFFSVHVIEHLPSPLLLWDSALKVLKPDGLIMLFTPNGELSLQHRIGRDYHRLWGQAHPLLLTAEALDLMAERLGFVGRSYTSPYDLTTISAFVEGELNGDELLFLARRTPVRAPVTHGRGSPATKPEVPSQSV